jgi:Cu2+-exporting ATPase
MSDHLSTLQVIHSIPGRIRLRVHSLADHHNASALTEHLQANPHIINIRVNRACAAVIIHYSTRTLTLHGATTYFCQFIRSLELTRSTTTPVTSETDNEGDWSSLKLPALATLLAIASQRWPHPLLRTVTVGVLGACVFPILQRAVNSLWRDRKLNIDGLDLLAVGLSGLQGKLITPALVITLHELGDILREQTARSTAIKTADLLEAIGHYAWVEREGKIVQIASDQVQLGETVIVYPGEQIPVDGTVIQGEATIDQQQLTGESMPIVAEAGTYVYASTLVRSGKIRLKAEKIGTQTRAAASLELLQTAPVHDTRMANYASQVADRLIIPALLLATLVLITTRDPARAAAILTLDFVTGIRVSIPTAFLGALNHTTRHGILVRSGRTLEQLASVDTIVFDKTGTLTQGEVQVVAVTPVVAGLTESKLLRWAAATEQRITHPVAEAIVHYAQQQQIEIPDRHDWQYDVGLGIRATIDNQQVMVGSSKFLQKHGISLDWGEQLQPSVNTALIYVACDGVFQGVIHYTDPLRLDSLALVERLQRLGLEIHLLTGDSTERAKAVGKELGIDPSKVHAEAFPEQKAVLVRELHRSGKTVAFVGDGLNDSVALAYADVSVSFEDGSEVARETADVVLMNNDLTNLLEAIAISQETQRLIEQNTALVVGPNLLALGLATTVGLSPLMATLIHNGSAIAAGLNSLRPLLQHQLETNVNRI